MGNIYAAYDPELDRRIALKVLRADLLVSEARDRAQARLLHEAQAAARLNHPNVVTVYDVGTVGERLFIAMEEIQGLNLGRWLAARRRSRREILDVFEQAGRGLAAAHRAGLVHRDFKPGNVMVDDHRRARVVDFGLAHAVLEPREGGDLGPSEAARAGGSSRLAGTPAYMAPEQLAGEGVDARSDQYSFCVALWEALYGERPSGGALSTAGRRPPARVEKPVPVWLRRILERGLAADPEERFESMDALLAALSVNPRRRFRRRVAAGLGGLVVLATTVGWFEVRARRELLCSGAERHLVGIWDDARRTDLRTAFLATGDPRAASIWSRLERQLDAHAQTWIELHTEFCQATHLRGEQSVDRLDRQMACLDGRLDELDALIEIFVQADRDVVVNALSATEQLIGPRICAGRQELGHRSLTPTDPQLAERVRLQRTRLATARSLEKAGQYRRSLETAQEAHAAALELAFPPLLAESHFQVAISHGRLGQLPEMKEHLHAALSLALEQDLKEVRAQALTALIVHAHMTGEPEDARFWGELARAALEPLPGRADIESQRLVFVGLAAQLEGDHHRAIESFEAAMRLDPELTPISLSSTLSNIAISYQALGETEVALRFFRQALEQHETGYGSQHPGAAYILDSLGLALREDGQLQEAIEVYRRCLETFEIALPDHPFSIYPLVGLGGTLIEAQRPEEAMPFLERAVEVGRREGVDPAALGRGLFELARAAHATGQGERAARLAREAQTIFTSLGERVRADREAVEEWIESRRAVL